MKFGDDSEFKNNYGTEFLSWKIFVNSDAECHFEYIFFLTCIYYISSVIVLGCKYWTVEFPIVSCVIIISIAIVIGLLLLVRLLK